jgi:DNA polymerase-1
VHFGNFQNLPNQTKLRTLGLQDYDIRSMFVAQPGHTFIISDYSGIELSILAAMSGDDTLIEKILEGDVHSFVANALYENVLAQTLGERVTPKNRKEGKWKVARDEFKRVSYAICYGSTGWNIFRTCAHNLATIGVPLTREEADRWVERWKHELFPKTGALFDSNGYKAVTQYYTESVLGRKRYWSMAEVRTDQKRYWAAMREGMNQPIQSTSADMTKLAMFKLDSVLDWSRARVVACIHDELLVEARDDYRDEAAALTKWAMETAGHDLLPHVDKGLVIAEPKMSDRYNK